MDHSKKASKLFSGFLNGKFATGLLTVVIIIENYDYDEQVATCLS